MEHPLTSSLQHYIVGIQTNTATTSDTSPRKHQNKFTLLHTPTHPSLPTYVFPDVPRLVICCSVEVLSPAIPCVTVSTPPPPPGWRTACCGERNCCGCCFSRAARPLGGIAGEGGREGEGREETRRKCKGSIQVANMYSVATSHTKL